MYRHIVIGSVIISMLFVIGSYFLSNKIFKVDRENDLIYNDSDGIQTTQSLPLQTVDASSHIAFSDDPSPTTTTDTDVPLAAERQEQEDIDEVVDADDIAVSEAIRSQQQARYEVLATILPRFNEISHRIDELEAARPQQAQWMENASEEEIGARREEVRAWRTDFAVWQEEEIELSLEKLEIQESLAESFPEAIENTNQFFMIDYRKLRELVGGSLPTDERIFGKRVKSVH